MPDRFNTRISDYLKVGERLFLQRHITFAVITILVSLYYDTRVALLFYTCFVCLEGLDWVIAREGRLRLLPSAPPQRTLYVLILTSSVLYSSMIAAYVLSLAAIEGVGQHAVPLLFLFTSVLFAAVNNHQIPSVLLIRLSIYAVCGLLVTGTDLLRTQVPLETPLWLQFFTTIVVIFFLAECARQFVVFYREKLETIERLERDRELTVQAYQAKSEFLSVVSHELRTPLTSMVGALQLLDQDSARKLSELDRELLSVARRNSDRLLILINDLLDFQALDAGRLRLRRAPVLVTDLISDALHGVEGIAATRRIKISLTSSGAGLRTIGDHDRLVQVVINVLSNAIKFSPNDSKVTIDSAYDGDELVISVSDQGKGISDGAKERVFEALTQVDSSDRRLFGGTGLGMAISKMIMEAHQGSIDYSSELGVGTTFTLRLPSSASEPAASPRQPTISLAPQPT